MISDRQDDQGGGEWRDILTMSRIAVSLRMALLCVSSYEKRNDPSAASIDEIFNLTLPIVTDHSKHTDQIMRFPLNFTKIASEPLQAGILVAILLLVVNYAIQWKTNDKSSKPKILWLNAILAGVAASMVSYASKTTGGFDEIVDTNPPSW